jgi:CubicO group peptidase (beta-lactamase class C family)
MLRRALPLVLATLVIVPALAQDRIVSSTFRSSGATAQAPGQRAAAAQAPYFPERFDWQHKKPDEVGMNPALVNEAVQLAIAADTPGPHDMTQFLTNSFGKEPFFSLIGPIKDRGPASGIITRHGYIVAEWGDPKRADITNSVTKTFLTTVVGLAWQRGLIKDVNDYARDYMPPHVDLFDAPHNQKIKWDDLLRQTSDWQGTLWGRPDWADRPVGATLAEQENRKLYEPGSHFKYNDVRVNVMALAALQVWRKPLPEVLREEVMNPIGASSTWRWYGYENSWVDIDGQKVQSVSGGGHWGGGMFIDSYDMARFGYLFLRNGKWKDKSIVSDKWIKMARTPGSDNKTYGFANWYLNTDQKPLPAAPATVVRFVGNGSNIVYIDWDNDIVAVFRWIRGDKQLNEVVAKMYASLKTTSTAAAQAQR